MRQTRGMRRQEGCKAPSLAEVVARLEARARVTSDNTPPNASRRLRRLLEAVGEPDRALRIVLVVGTCGKGSTATMLAALLRARGCRVGLFTGPHLECYTERFAIDGKAIEGAELARRLHHALDKLEPTQGPDRGADWSPVLEWLALVALGWFRDEDVTWAVMEAGAGGARDYCAALQPELVVLTSVALDHRAVLGDSVAVITREKLGVLPGGGLLVCGARDPESLAVVRERVADLQARALLLGEDFAADTPQVTADGTSFLFRPGPRLQAQVGESLPQASHLRVRLHGVHQARNAAVALAAAACLGVTQPGRWRRRLHQAWMPGRFEVLHGEVDIVLDGAHQPAGARSLCEALRDRMGKRPCVLVLGILRDKQPEVVARIMAGVASAIVLTQPPWGERTGSLEEVRAAILEVRPELTVELEARPLSALGRARQMAQDLARLEAQDRIAPCGQLAPYLCVTGSLYLLGAVRSSLTASPAPAPLLPPTSPG